MLFALRHAWQKLGRMSPEEAMEKYVSLLSESIPSWKAQGEAVRFLFG